MVQSACIGDLGFNKRSRIWCRAIRSEIMCQVASLSYSMDLQRSVLCKSRNRIPPFQAIVESAQAACGEGGRGKCWLIIKCLIQCPQRICLHLLLRNHACWQEGANVPPSALSLGHLPVAHSLQLGPMRDESAFDCIRAHRTVTSTLRLLSAEGRTWEAGAKLQFLAVCVAGEMSPSRLARQPHCSWRWVFVWV